MNRLLPVALLLVAAAAAFLILSPGVEDGGDGGAGTAGAVAEDGRPAAGTLDGGGSGGDGAGASAVERTEAGDGGSGGAAAGAGGGMARVRARFVDAGGAAVRDLEVRADEDGGFRGMGFRISVGDEEDATPRATPDGNGVAVLEVPSGESLTLRTRGDYWAPLEIPLQALRPGETLDLGTRTLSPAARVHGVVRGADGRPLAGAQVALRSEQGFGFGLDMARLRATTDAEGRYAVGGVRAGSYLVDVDGPRHARETLNGFLVPRGGGDLREDFDLEPGMRAFGMVVDQDRNPIAGAELRVQQGGFGFLTVTGPGGVPRTPAGAVTRDDGRFSLDGLPAQGGARVLATAPGYAPTSEPFTGEGDELVLEMRRQVRFAGTLLDQDGRPAPGVDVRLRPLARDDWRFWLREQQATTDAEGRFAIADLPPGRYGVEASTPTAALSGVERQVDVDTADVELRMQQVPVLVVRVVDDIGAPVPGARVSVRPQQGGGRGGGFSVRSELGEAMLDDLDGSPMAVGGSERTDEQGRAWFPELGEGIYDLTVRAEGKAELRRPLVRARGPQTEEAILLPGADLRVQVVDADGRAVEGVNVILEEAAGGRARTRVSDVAGRAWWDGLAPGRYVARAEAGAGTGNIVFRTIGEEEPDRDLPEGEPVDIAAGDHADLVLTVDRLAMPELLVTRGGQPVAGAEARLERVSEGDGGLGFDGLMMQGDGATTGPDGRVRLAPAEPGDYKLWVRPTPGSPESEKTVRLSAGSNEIEFEVQGSTVEGRILGSQGPLAGARVSLKRHREDQPGGAQQTMIFAVSISGPGGDVVTMSGGSPVASVRSDDEGRFVFEDVPAGDWVVVATARGYMEWKSEPFPVSGSGRVDAGVGRMEAGGRIEGRVPRAEGSGGFSSRNLVELRSEDGKTRDVTVARDGRYAFDDLTPGRYVVEYDGEESPVLEVGAGRTTTFNW